MRAALRGPPQDTGKAWKGGRGRLAQDTGLRSAPRLSWQSHIRVQYALLKHGMPRLFYAKRTAMVTPRGWSGRTAVNEEYGMWVMPISAFVELDKLQPHQILRASGKIVQYNESMSTVFFLSHQ